MYTAYSSTNLVSFKATDFITIPFADLDDFNGWLLRDPLVVRNILRIQQTGEPLGNLFDIKNGFATLHNDLFVFTPEHEDDRFYYFQKEGKTCQVEKGICKSAIKPNIIKTENDIISKREMLIFPYLQLKDETLFNAEITIKLFSEKYFKDNHPYAYRYLESAKSVLAKRDNGNKRYENWFAFGRNQALTLSGNKLLFPYISNHPYFVFTDEQELFFYNGYAILSDSVRELKILQKILCSKIFWYYIVNASKPYENDYYSLAKNYIKYFGVCTLDNREKDLILTLNGQALDIFLANKYNVTV